MTEHPPTPSQSHPWTQQWLSTSCTLSPGRCYSTTAHHLQTLVFRFRKHVRAHSATSVQWPVLSDSKKIHCVLEKEEPLFPFTHLNWWDRNLFLQGDSCSFHYVKAQLRSWTSNSARADMEVAAYSLHLEEVIPNYMKESTFSYLFWSINGKQN